MLPYSAFKGSSVFRHIWCTKTNLISNNVNVRLIRVRLGSVSTLWSCRLGYIGAGLDRNTADITCINISRTYSRVQTLSEDKKVVADLTVNHKLAIHPECAQQLQAGVKHRKHSGIQRVSPVKLPPRLLDAVDTLQKRYPIQDLSTKSEQLERYLWQRLLPLEEKDFERQKQDMRLKILAEENINIRRLSKEDLDVTESFVADKVLSRIRQHSYHWQEVKYDAFKSFIYLAGRLAFDYSTYFRIFSEIKKRQPDFSPSSVFHYRSAVGAGVWAVQSVWQNSVEEHHCVDQSDDMNTLARLLLQDGQEDNMMCFPGVYFRVFLSPFQTVKYSIVVCGFALSDLPNRTERLKVIETLWSKTSDYLVIVENGTNAGHQLVMEARRHVLHLSQEGEDQTASVHVFAPCPHDMACPRQTRHDGTPCNFEVDFYPLNKKPRDDKPRTGRFSFVVLKRGVRDDASSLWPRVVRPGTCVSRSVHLHLCSPSGRLEYSVVTSNKHGKDLYRCAKACQWGDLLPAVQSSEEGKVYRKKNKRHDCSSSSDDDEKEKTDSSPDEAPS